MSSRLRWCLSRFIFKWRTTWIKRKEIVGRWKELKTKILACHFKMPADLLPTHQHIKAFAKAAPDLLSFFAEQLENQWNLIYVQWWHFFALNVDFLHANFFAQPALLRAPMSHVNDLVSIQKKFFKKILLKRGSFYVWCESR